MVLRRYETGYTWLPPNVQEPKLQIDILTTGAVNYSDLSTYDGYVFLQATASIGSFSFKIPNVDGQYLGVFDEGDYVDIYMEYTSGTPTSRVFRGRIDNARPGFDRSGYFILIEGRDYGVFADDDQTISYSETNVLDAFSGTTGTQDSQDNYPDGLLYDIGLLLEVWNPTSNSWDLVKDLSEGDYSVLKQQSVYDETITDQFRDKKYVSIAKEICSSNSLEFYLWYYQRSDESSETWKIRIFPENTIQNSNEAITYGQNLINMSPYGSDNREKSNDVTVYGSTNSNIILVRRKSDSPITPWRKTKKLTKSELTTMAQVDARASSELVVSKTSIAKTTFNSIGLLTLKPGELFRCSVPLCAVNGWLTSKKVTHNWDKVIDTSVTVGKIIKDITDWVNEQNNKQESGLTHNNLNDMDNSFNLSFIDDEDDWLTTTDCNTSEGVLKLDDDKTSGVCLTKSTSTVSLAAFSENIISCELRIRANHHWNCSYRVSNDNGLTWETILSGAAGIHTFSSIGKNLRIETTLNVTAEGTSPQFDDIEVLVKHS